MDQLNVPQTDRQIACLNKSVCQSSFMTVRVKYKPASLSKAGQFVQEFRETVLHSAEVSVDVLCAVRGPDERLVVGEGQLTGLLQDLSPLFRQTLRLPR